MLAELVCCRERLGVNIYPSFWNTLWKVLMLTLAGSVDPTLYFPRIAPCACAHMGATHSGRVATDASSDKIVSDDLFSTSKATLLPSPNPHTHRETRKVD